MATGQNAFLFPLWGVASTTGSSWAGDVETCVIPRVESQANNLTIVPALGMHHNSKGAHPSVTATKTAANILIRTFYYMCWQWEGFSIAIWEAASSFLWAAKRRGGIWFRRGCAHCARQHPFVFELDRLTVASLFGLLWKWGQNCQRNCPGARLIAFVSLRLCCTFTETKTVWRSFKKQNPNPVSPSYHLIFIFRSFKWIFI